MAVLLIHVPYHLGREGYNLGRGPLKLARAGDERILTEAGFIVLSQTVQREGPYKNRLEAITKVNEEVRHHVKEAKDRGDFPLLLAGNCNVSLGVMGGLPPETGLIWFDSHGDFNTPDTTISGYFDGMPLAILTGYCHGEILKRLQYPAPLPESHTMLIGIQNLDPKEQDLLEKSQVTLIWRKELQEHGIPSVLGPKLENLSRRVKEIYLHCDIDVLDPKLSPGVSFPCKRGLSLEELKQAVREIHKRFRVRAASITNFNPEHDKNDRTLHVCLDLMKLFCSLSKGSGYILQPTTNTL